MRTRNLQKYIFMVLSHLEFDS